MKKIVVNLGHERLEHNPAVWPLGMYVIDLPRDSDVLAYYVEAHRNWFGSGDPKVFEVPEKAYWKIVDRGQGESLLWSLSPIYES